MYAYDFCLVFQATGGSRPGWKWLLVLRRVWKRYCKISWIHEVSPTDRLPEAIVLCFSLHRVPALPLLELDFHKILWLRGQLHYFFNRLFHSWKNLQKSSSKFLCDYTNSGLYLIKATKPERVEDMTQGWIVRRSLCKKPNGIFSLISCSNFHIHI